jgi:CDP-diacylglycerol--glycerol-3-phosphate 3-phosphatidyltransferase
MQRPERVVVTSVAALACGIVGQNVSAESFDAVSILIWAMGIIAVFANLTAFARLNHCRKAMTKK